MLNLNINDIIKITFMKCGLSKNELHKVHKMDAEVRSARRFWWLANKWMREGDRNVELEGWMSELEIFGEKRERGMMIWKGEWVNWRNLARRVREGWWFRRVNEWIGDIWRGEGERDDDLKGRMSELEKREIG